MSELRELYQEIILDHGRDPRNFGPLKTANRKKEGYNPLCGDKITLYLEEKEGVLSDLRFEGCGCAIAMATASLMTENLKGKSVTTANELFHLFHQLVTRGSLLEPELEKLGKLSILKGVAEFPLRVKCATLAWHTLHALLKNDDNLVSTE